MKARINVVFGSDPSGASVVGVLYKNLVGSSAPQSVLDEYGDILDNGSMTATELGIAVADHDLNTTNIDDETEADAGKHKTFFGLETGDGVVYAVVIILTLIFIRQVSVVIAALN